MRTPGPLFLLAAGLAGLVSLPARAAEKPAYTEGFENGLAGWSVADPPKQPLVLSTERSHSGKASGYSGPPGTTRVSRHEFVPSLVGRLSVWFYDDMAPAKQQMAAVQDADGEFLGILCHGGARYQCRVGMTYTEVPVARSLGWHEFAWECSGRRTEAFIDGRRVFTNDHLLRIRTVVLGSYWDDSTGWYDDVTATPREPAQAGAWSEAEDALAHSNPAPAAASKAGASGTAMELRRPGEWLEWSLQAPGGEAQVLLAKVAAGGAARCRVAVWPAGQPSPDPAAPVVLPAGAGWRWAAFPAHVPAGRAKVRLTLESGSVALDWVALAPIATGSAGEYGKALDEMVQSEPQLRRCWDSVGATGDMAAPLALLEGSGSLPASAAQVRWLVAAERRRLDEAWQARLHEHAADLKGIFKLPDAVRLGPETPLSRECYRRLLRYARYSHPLVREWPMAPGCRYHKVDNSGEHAVRQNATVALSFAILATMGDYDEKLAGAPRDAIRADMVGILRYLALTHSANFLPTGDGHPWGDAWQSAFWAGIAGHAAWLAWDLLDDDTRLLVARMVEHEADRFNTRPPDSGEWSDTKAEENAWNSEVIALAECMFPHHPNAALWHERAVDWMINSFSEAADKQDETVVDGRKVKEWVTTTDVHPDHTLENHDRVHPDYLSTFTLTLRNALLYAQAGKETPRSAFHHAADAYGVLKHLTAVNGSAFYVNGQDWWPHRHDCPLASGALMGVLADDPEGTFLERSTLDWLARMHSRFPDGRAWDRREFNYPNAEEELMARYAELYLLHRMFGDGPAPVSRQAFLKAQSGVHVFDIGGFVTHRTPEKFASFAWVNGAMGLVYADDDTWLTSPWERGLVGRITCDGVKDTAPKVLAHQVHTGFGGFAFVGRLERCEGKVEQAVCMASLPDAPVFYLETLRALAPVDVRDVATGAFGILNEDAAPITPNRRVVAHAGESTTVQGAGGAAGLLKWKTPWADVDGRLGVAGTAGQMAYRDNNAYAGSRLHEELFANYLEGIGARKAGEEISTSAVIALPGRPAAEAAKVAVEVVRFGQAGIAARGAGWIVAANPGDAPAEGDIFGRHVSLPALGAAVFPER